MTSVERNWLVVGFGSDLGGDDRFGLAVAEAVAQVVARRKLKVTVLAQRFLGPELVENIRAACGVIFVDASAVLAPGVLQCIDLQNHTDGEGAGRENTTDKENLENNSAMAMSHHCNPRTLIALNLVLHGESPPAWLLVAGGCDFSLSETMSAAVAALVTQATGQIIDLVQK